MKYMLKAIEVAKNGAVEIEDSEMILNTFFHPQTGKSMIAILVPVEEEEEEGVKRGKGG